MVGAQRWLGAAAVVAALTSAGTACAPPKTPLDVGVKDVPTDVVIGPESPSTTTSGGPSTTVPVP